MNGNIADKRKECARAAGQIALLAMKHVNWNSCLEMWNIDGAKRSKPQLLLDAAFRQECNPDTRFDQSLLGGQAVDDHDRHIV